MKVEFEIYNVFSENHWNGNPLAIVTKADDLSDLQMQSIARQFNLSETVFILNSSDCVAAVRIFTTTSEMQFAGHPTIGAAAWLHENMGLEDKFTIQTKLKAIEINHRNNIYYLKTKGYSTQESTFTKEYLASNLGVSLEDIASSPIWISTGSWQLLVELSNHSSIARVSPNFINLVDTSIPVTRPNLYVWYREGNIVHSRYFFSSDGVAIEDPATGSACANLGAWAYDQKIALVMENNSSRIN